MPPKGRYKYDWNSIKVQFLLSDHQDFAAFVNAFKLPKGLIKSKEARFIADVKRGIIERESTKAREALLTEPVRERESRRMKILEELESSGRALRAAIMNRLVPDIHLTQRTQNESVESWADRIKMLKANEQCLTPTELLALAGAQKVADELTRRAAGLEDFDWEHYEKNQQMLNKAEGLRIEVVKTSGAKPLDQLEHAPEDRKAKGSA